MRESANEYQLSKVFVFRDNYALLLSRQRHEGFVRSARVYVNSRQHIVACGDQRI